MKLSQEEMLRRLQAALDEGRNFQEISDVVEKCRSGEWQWHQNGSGVVITSLSENKRGKKILQGRIIFGDLEDVIAMSDRIDQFGRDHGCVEFVCDGRTGWLKVLKKIGWHPVGVILSKEL